MSVDATDLERSALERKDRDELLTIAKALGGKPPARAKKADIVDLVLQLTGVESESGDAAPTPVDEEPKARAPRTRKATVAPTVSAGPTDEPPAEWEAAAAAPDEVDDAPADDAAPANRQDRGGQNGQQGRQDRGGQSGPAGQRRQPRQPAATRATGTRTRTGPGPERRAG